MIAAASAGRFQAAWFLSLALFGVAAMSAAGVVFAQATLRSMWRSGDHGLAILVGVAAGLFAAFSLTLLVAVAVGLLRRAFEGG